jgi:signal transduction histidine kinase
MRTVEVFRARAFRLALAFSLAVSIATAAAFTFIYLQVSNAGVQRAGAVLVDEASKSRDDSESRLRQALELRLTRDIRRLDYVALFDSSGRKLLGNVPAMPAIPVDGAAHVVRTYLLPAANGLEPAIFVAARRPDGGIILLGRSMSDAYELEETVFRALAVALVPTILLILAIGAFFSRRASIRLERVRDAIVRIMNGELHLRLPVSRDKDDLDKVAQSVNLMLNEIERLLDQLRSVGDNIAHDLRTPLMVARTKIERALDADAGVDALRQTLAAALGQIDKASATISAILRISAVENGAWERRFADVDLSAVCAEVFEFYEPLAQSKSVALHVDAGEPVVVAGDEALMREAIANLVDNAIKFTPAGGKVGIEAQMVAGLPQVIVSDTGCGVAPGERDKIFKRFYRSSETPGHGLGLSIAETIARLHGFELSVEDNNPGARFAMRRGAKADPSLERKAA